MPACRIASLCISTPLHAGIISLSTPNSSFILDRLRLSMIECAVLRAIFLPAADVADGCFFLPWELVAGLVGAELEVGVVGVGGSSRGFICMIFLARVGGGGRSSFALALPDNVRFLVITGEAGGEDFIAEGGRANEFSISVIALSLGVGPVELAGVGGSFVRGIVRRQHLQ